MKEYWTEERKNKKSLDMLEYYNINGTEKVINALKKRYSDKEFKNRFDIKMNDVNKNTEKRKKAGQTIKEKWNNDEDFKEKMKNRKVTVLVYKFNTFIHRNRRGSFLDASRRRQRPWR